MSTTPAITEDETEEVHTHTRRIRFTGAEPVLIRRSYSHGGKLFLPNLAVAKWDHGQEIKVIRVYGQVLKKDGTPGEVRTEMEYGTRFYKGFMGYPDAPDWLLDLFGITTSKEAKA